MAVLAIRLGRHLNASACRRGCGVYVRISAQHRVITEYVKMVPTVAMSSARH